MLQVVNPYNQQLVTELSWETEASLNSKLEAAQSGYRRWREVPLTQRITQVQACLDHFRTNADAIAHDITLQMGKPLAEARQEVNTMLGRAEYMIDIAEATLSPEVLSPLEGFHRRIEHAPLGVVFDIAAWNYPLLIPVNAIVPALLAGNAVVLKHSPRTPLCGQHFEKAFESLEIPHLVTNVILDVPQTQQVLRDSRINHVAFTGSVAVGKKVYETVGTHRLIDIGLELGGNDAAYIAEDADLEFTVANVVEGACYNAGQSCCAVERVYVHHRIYEEVLHRAQELMDQLQLGDPLEASTTLGPLARQESLGMLTHQVQDAKKLGAQILLGGEPMPDTAGNFFHPTLLAHVPNQADVMQEESFGPIVPIQSVANDEEALANMNESCYGLTASLWTQDRERAERLARDLEVGTVFQNRCDYLDPALPWTGARDSGKGSTLSPHGFYAFTRRKSIHFRTY